MISGEVLLICEAQKILCHLRYELIHGCAIIVTELLRKFTKSHIKEFSYYIHTLI